MWLVPANNPDGIALWDQLLLEGRRLTGRGGSDVHHQNVSISYSPLGERIELWADADADADFEATMGDASEIEAPLLYGDMIALSNPISIAD